MSQIVISASRRTDIPAFYMPWFMDRIDKGYFEVVNPYNRRTSIVPATPAEVHTIVFWSKNFGPFITGRYGEKLIDAGYHLFFNYTLNSVAPLLEPNLPPLQTRMSQLAIMSERFGPRTINWRFDPICFYQEGVQSPSDNLNDFESLAAQAARCGIRRCITSFRDDYRKIRRRTGQLPGFAFRDPSLETQKATILRMEKLLAAKQIDLQVCCESKLLAHLPSTSTVTGSACIPNDLLMRLFGGSVSLKKDSGQRRQLGCGCFASMDIGLYDRHPCYHNCLFCYANPACDGKKAKDKGLSANGRTLSL
jgi:hypothetical protein